ncbi:exonuclease domain-containing protein [Lysinibacillus sphaericus]|uniref:exonuclease domain-containing protein n=1 Tax=Lysinibacillus sphaericus TaxID=1421 RepID=UPI003D7FC90B
MKGFVAIDFETASPKSHSACSIGLVVVENNQIVNEHYFLMCPAVFEMDSEHQSIHGLALIDVMFKPKFHKIWPQISHYFNGDYYIVAHNAQFDLGVLKSCLDFFDIATNEFDYFCTIPFTNRVCGSDFERSLKARAEYFSIPLENHHHGLEDARVCAELVLRSLKAKGIPTVEEYIRVYNDIPIKAFSVINAPNTFGKTKFRSTKITDIQPSTTVFDITHPLFDKQIVFSGELKSFDRTKAAKLAANYGAILKSGVSRKTDYLILGEQDKKLVGSKGKSTKEIKAQELIDKGFDIQIIYEDDFISLISRKMDPVHMKQKVKI